MIIFIGPDVVFCSKSGRSGGQDAVLLSKSGSFCHDGVFRSKSGRFRGQDEVFLSKSEWLGDQTVVFLSNSGRLGGQDELFRRSSCSVSK
jgi:hypothetical protein